MGLKECEHNRKECELHAELQSFEGLYSVYMRIWGKYGGTELYTTAWSTF